MIRVCYIPHGSEHHLIREIASLLRKDMEFVFAMKSRRTSETYKKDGIETYGIWEIFNSDTQFSEDELLALDLKYGPPDHKGNL